MGTTSLQALQMLSKDGSIKTRATAIFSCQFRSIIRLFPSTSSNLYFNVGKICFPSKSEDDDILGERRCFAVFSTELFLLCNGSLLWSEAEFLKSFQLEAFDWLRTTESKPTRQCHPLNIVEPTETKIFFRVAKKTPFF